MNKCACLYISFAMFFITELLLERMFESMKNDLTKIELRQLLKKLKLPEDYIYELEQRFPGREQLPQRTVAGLRYWKSYFGPAANMDELIRITHIINFDRISSKLKVLKFYAQRMRL